ncbi:MAG: hypothetical protein ACTHZ9_11300 [Leucobacter sp.]
MPAKALVRELQPHKERDLAMERRRRATVEADRIIRERALAAEEGRLAELERLAQVEQRKVAARVTAQQTEEALKFLDRRTA